ncbi:MAG: methyl-accepting chemotaxis protein [Anaeromyxobacteraceae bacterium]
MAFVRALVLKLSAALLVPAGIAWWAAQTYFASGEAAHALVAVGIPSAFAAAVAVTAAAVWLCAAPLRAAARAGAAADASAAAARERAGRAALRLPARVATVVALVTCASVAVLGVACVQVGLAPDVALAAFACGAGLAVMTGLFAYSVSALATAPVTAGLGASDHRGGGSTLRGKLLVVCCGLLAMATLFVGGAGYARFRGDTDRQVLANAAAVQERAAMLVAERGAAAAAELVYLATGAPTAIVAADGAVLASAGGELPVRSRGAAATLPGAVALPGGWCVSRPVVRGTSIVSFVSDAPVRERRRAFWGDQLLLGAALFLAGAALVWLAASSLTLPLAFLGQAADRIAAGDLTASPPSLSRDEMGQLAADFRKMTHGLTALVVGVQAASEGVHDGAREMGAIGDRVRGGAREEGERVLAVRTSVEGMQGSVETVGRGIEGLSEYVHATGAAVGAMASALDDVRRKAQELEARSAAAAGDVDALAGAGRRAQTQLGLLDDLAGTAQGTLAQVSGSLSGLETSAVASQLAAAQAAELAEHAGGVVQETVLAIEGLHGAVDDAKRRVAVLGRRSDDIDQILDFVGEVAKRTNLLSLNASIIATQAGEHGKAFAVVADQIRELAAQISSSTKSIGEIIRAVRDDVSGTARLIDRGDALAADGVARARRSLEALEAIRSATAKGHETAAAIRDAVQVHAHSTRDVSSLVASVGEHSRSLADAVQLVGKSVATVGAVSRAVGALADEVSRSLEEQAGVGRRQLDGVERIDGMLAEIGRAMEAHQAAARRAREALGHLGRTTELHQSSVVELSGVAERLGGRSKALAEHVGKFKIELRG